jgi:flagellar hook-associated protein 3 FlgL
MKQSADDHLLSVSSQLSDIEDVDLPKAIQPSLIDFLR